MNPRDPLGIGALRSDLRDLRTERDAAVAKAVDAERRADEVSRRAAGAYRRGVQRAGKRNLMAAGRIDRMTGDWPTTTISVDDLIRRNMRSIRARSRNAYWNNGYIRRFAKMCETNLIGPRGLVMQARIRDEFGKADPLASDCLETAWQTWAASKTCDSRRRLTWAGIQRQAAINAPIDGEILAVTDVTYDTGSPRFSVRLVDPELLNVDHNVQLKGGGYIRLGVEFTPEGRPIAYHFALPPTTADQSMDSAMVPATRPVRVPIERVIHSYIGEMAGQSRGMPWSSAGLWEAHLIDKYGEAALVAARMGANNPMFIRDGEETAYEGEEKDANGDVVIPSEPGEYGHLAHGQDLVTHDSKYPSGDFDPFVKAHLRKLASAVSVSYNGLASDLEGVNYSSMRSGVQDEREVWKALQEWFIEDFAFEVYRRWLTFSLLAGTLLVPTAGGPMPLSVAREEKYHQVFWQARRWQWVDPLRDMQANELAIKLRLSSPQRICREQGEDFEHIVDEIAAAEAYCQAKGVTLIGGVATPAPSPSAAGSDGTATDPTMEDPNNVDANA